MIKSLQADFEEAKQYLINVLNEDPSAGPPPSERDVRWRRRAIAGATLAHFGEMSAVFPLLATSDDPSLRSFIAHFFSEIPIESAGIIDMASDEAFDPSVLRILIQGLGSLEETLIPAVRRTELTGWLTDLHQEHPDAGVHSMSGWALRQWGVDTNQLAAIATLEDSGSVAEIAKEIDQLEDQIKAARQTRPSRQLAWQQEIAERPDKTLDSDWRLRLRLKFDREKSISVTGSEVSTSIKIDQHESLRRASSVMHCY